MEEGDCAAVRGIETDDHCDNQINHQQGFGGQLEAGGESKKVTSHLREREHEGRDGLTPDRVRQALEHWLVRCVSEDKKGRPGWTYWGLVEFRGQHRLMRIALSMDGQRIASAYLDRNATKAWRRGSTDFFEQRCQGKIEIRDDFTETGIRFRD